MDKSILYIGRFFSPNILKLIKNDSNGKVGFSNHNFELSIIYGLIRHKEIKLSVITLPAIYSYPHNSKTFNVKAEKFWIDEVPAKSVGFCNLMVINKILSTFSLLFAILKYYTEENGDDIKIIVNTPKMNLLVAVLLSKYLTRKKVSIVLIIPDVPIMMTRYNKQNKIKENIVEFFDNMSMSLASKCDYFVLLTDYMKDFFKKPIKYTVVEAVLDEKKYENFVPKRESEKYIILYTGTLNKYFGILNLIQAVEALDRKDTELWICGSGDSREEIEKKCICCNKIKYLGLKDVEETKKLQMCADILVNPRGAKGEFTKYSFPSKNLEYMMTGNVVIINKLPGIPEEYYEYVICPKDESVESWTKAINNVLNMSSEDRKHLGERSKDFVMRNKTAYVQVSKILDMVYNDCQS